MVKNSISLCGTTCSTLKSDNQALLANIPAQLFVKPIMIHFSGPSCMWHYYTTVQSGTSQLLVALCSSEESCAQWKVLAVYM